MAFVSFEALEKAVNNDTVRFVRIMTDTSLQNVAWSDDGALSNNQKDLVQRKLSKIGQVEYLGVRADEQLLVETMKACQLGWLAQALDELTSGIDKNLLDKVLVQYQTGQSFSDIARAVATTGGSTEAGINATKGQFSEAFSKVSRRQLEAGLFKAQEKSEYLVNFVNKSLV